MRLLSTIVLPLMGACVSLPLLAVPMADAAPAETRITAFTTGYSWYDNTPAGSAAIAKPVLHEVAGGTGTYADPITLAVGRIGTTWAFPAGTRFYIPTIQRYFIAEDYGGAQWAAAANNADAWLDLWVDGRSVSQSTANSCMNKFTAVHTVVVNPRSDYVVASGAGIIHDGLCDVGYSETPVAISPVVPTPTLTTPPSPKPSPTASSSVPAPSTTTTRTPAPSPTATRTSTPAPAPTTTTTTSRPSPVPTSTTTSAPAPKPQPQTPVEYYSVRVGDTLYLIAVRNGIPSWRDIYVLNADQISDPDLIYPGQRLRLR